MDKYVVYKFWYISDPCFEENKLREIFLLECDEFHDFQVENFLYGLGFPSHRIYKHKFEINRPSVPIIQSFERVFNLVKSWKKL